MVGLWIIEGELNASAISASVSSRRSAISRRSYNSDPEEVKKEGGRGRVVVSKEQGKKEGDFILV